MEVPLATVTGALAILSVLVGSVAALRQRSYTRMLGYAGVAQVGYALIALCALHRPTAAAFLIATYAVASTGTFLAAAAVRRVRPEWDGSTAGMAGMARRAPVLSAGLAVLVISLAGIPPLLGFWGKFAVFLSVAGAAGAAFTGGATGVGWLYVIAGAMGIIGSVVSLGYYGSVLRALYLLPEPIAGQPAAAEAHEAGAPGAPGAPSAPEGVGTATWAVLIAASIVVVLGVLPVVAGWSAILGWIG
jgi:NADH-quinone oxidoreductase subunit N